MKHLIARAIVLSSLTGMTFGQQPQAEPSVTPAPLSQSLSTPNKPRLYIQSSSKGNSWNAHRDQSMEMSKDFEKECPGVRITLNQQMADYTVNMSHIEHGFARDNQFQIADKNGDLISRTKEGGSLKNGTKRACDQILSDWATKTQQPVNTGK